MIVVSCAAAIPTDLIPIGILYLPVVSVSVTYLHLLSVYPMLLEDGIGGRVVVGVRWSRTVLSMTCCVRVWGARGRAGGGRLMTHWALYCCG